MGARASEAVQVCNPPNVRIHLAYFCEGELYGELLKHLGRTMHDPDGLCVFAPWRESKNLVMTENVIANEIVDAAFRNPYDARSGVAGIRLRYGAGV